MNIVLDINILISAAWSPGRNATRILEAVFQRKFTACYDFRIIEEYERVLHYPKFEFPDEVINSILEPIIKNGIAVFPEPIKDISFERDETDRKFYEVAKASNSILISGNLSHFPIDSCIISPTEFIDKYL